mgnify:CR=1 FL=1
MKLGFVSAILDQSNYEEMMDIAQELGFQCVEVACWPQGREDAMPESVTLMWSVC